MRVRKLEVSNFRGIAHAVWQIDSPFVLLIGPGDSGKSSLLDALGWVLSPSWSLMATDADFHNGAAVEDIVVRSVVTNLPGDVIGEASFSDALGRWVDGEFISGLAASDGEIGIEIELRIDETLEPTWRALSDIHDRTLSARDRARLGLFVVDSRSERHLGWSRGSALGSQEGVTGDTTPVLVKAQRAARAAVWDAEMAELRTAADAATQAIRSHGVTPAGLRPGLAPQPANGPSRLLLHEDLVPLASRGTGSRRLASLALQGTGPSGGILCIDELEFGLEPHRLRLMLDRLSDGISAGQIGQVLATTHSPIALLEAQLEAIHVVRRLGGEVTVNSLARVADDDGLANRVRRANSTGLLAPAVLVGEGRTEWGLLRRMLEIWRFEGDPVNESGVEPIDGKGDPESRSRASLFASLGYRTAILVDTDRDEQPPDLHDTVTVFEWPGSMNIEERVLTDLPQHGVATALERAISLRSLESVRQAYAGTAGCRVSELSDTPADWQSDSQSDETTHRDSALEACRKAFKSEEGGQALADCIYEHWADLEHTSTGAVLSAVRSWVRGNCDD